MHLWGLHRSLEAVPIRLPKKATIGGRSTLSRRNPNQVMTPALTRRIARIMVVDIVVQIRIEIVVVLRVAAIFHLLNSRF